MSHPVLLILLFLAVAAAFFAVGAAWGRSRADAVATPPQLRRASSSVPLPDLSAGLPADAVDQLDALARRGQKVAAIRHYRQTTGLGLTEAKRVIDHWEDSRARHRAGAV